MRSMFAMARVAEPTVEAGRNVSSSPVCEAVSGGTPPGGGLASREGARWHGAPPTTPHRDEGQRHSQDCASGRDLHSGDTPRIQHHESLAVLTAQNPAGFGQRGDDVVDDLAFAARIAILVCDINVVTADQSDTKHKRFHVPHTRRAWHTTAMDSSPSVGDSRTAGGTERLLAPQQQRSVLTIDHAVGPTTSFAQARRDSQTQFNKTRRTQS